MNQNLYVHFVKRSSFLMLIYSSLPFIVFFIVGNLALKLAAVAVWLGIMLYFGSKLWNSRVAENAFAIKCNRDEITVRKPSGRSKSFRWDEIEKISFYAKVGGSTTKPDFNIVAILPLAGKPLQVQYSTFKGEYSNIFVTYLNLEELKLLDSWVQKNFKSKWVAEKASLAAPMESLRANWVDPNPPKTGKLHDFLGCLAFFAIATLAIVAVLGIIFLLTQL